MMRAKYGDLFAGTDRFTAGTRLCFERAVSRALLFSRSDGWPLRSAVRRATWELLVQGLDGHAILDALGAVVESAGRASRADRTALISGEPTWMAVRERVLQEARHELESCR